MRSVGGAWMDGRFPKITQDGRDGDELPGFVCSLGDGVQALYFGFEGTSLALFTLHK